MSYQVSLAPPPRGAGKGGEIAGATGNRLEDAAGPEGARSRVRAAPHHGGACRDEREPEACGSTSRDSSHNAHREAQETGHPARRARGGLEPTSGLAPAAVRPRLRGSLGPPTAARRASPARRATS